MLSRLGISPSGSVLVVALILSAVGVSNAQYHVNGAITGTITDPSGAVVSGVKVTATDTATNTSQSTMTNSAGSYLFSDMPPVTYTITAAKEGFRTCEGTGLVLEPSSTRTFSCALQVGQASETVSISADALQVQTDTSQLNGVINSTQIEQLPDNGRNFANFLALEPGVAGISFDSFNSMNIFATQGVSVNGLRDSDNNILIEGVSSQRTRDNAATTAAPAIDAIGEINVVSTGYMPEYSRGAGAQIVVQMKSGTDRYHGSLYEYNQNTDYDSAANGAPNLVGNPRGPINWNNFGGTFGGPVPGTHKKLFFFYSEDVTRQPGASPNKPIVPSALAHVGNFSEYCAAGIGCPTVPAFLAGKTDPNTGQTLVAGQPFPNDTIAPSFWSPNGSAFMAIYPMPNISSGTVANGLPNYYYLSQNPSNNHTESLKMDYLIDRWKSHLAFTLRHYRTNSYSDNFGNSPQLLDWSIQEPERGATIDLATTFSPTLVNDLTIGSTEDIVHVVLTQGALGNGLDRTSLGITPTSPGGIDFPYIFGPASKDVAGKTPTINFGGPNSAIDSFNSLTDAYPSHSVGHIYQFSDTLTKTIGKHILKFGAWIEHDGENDDDQLIIGGQNLNGQITIAGSGTNPHSTSLPLADMLLGVFDTYAEYGFRNETPWSSWQQGYFGQDTWKITPNLTIEGGLRWDYFPNYNSKWCNFAMFNPLAYSTLPGTQQVIDPSNGLVAGGNYYNGISMPCQSLPSSAYGHLAVFGEPFNAASASTINQQLVQQGIIRGYPPQILPNHYRAFQPRFGFAWDPFGTAKTTIRGSAGIFYNHETLSDQTQMGRNLPFQTGASPVNGDIDCPGTPQTASSFGCSGTGSVFTPGPVAPSLTNEQSPIPITGQDFRAPLPVVYSFHFGMQHMFPQNTLVEVGYVGTETRHFSVLEDLNEMQPGTFGPCSGTLTTCPAGSPYVYNSNVAQIQTVVPYPGFSNSAFTYQINNGNSAYNALQASARRSMTKHLMFTAVYTYANAHDIGSELQSSIIDHYNPSYNRGNPDWLQHHNLTTSYVYSLPFFEHKNNFAGAVLGGWELSGVFIYRSGSVNTISDQGANTSGMGVDNGVFAELVPGCNPNAGPRTKTEFFNPSCYTFPAAGTLGDSGRNTLFGPRFWIWDAGLHKNGPIFGEKLKYQFRAEAFNVLNHPIPNSLNTNINGGSAFGSVNGVYNNNGDQRAMQLGLRLIF